MDVLIANIWQILGVVGTVAVAVLGFFRKFNRLETRVAQLEKDVMRVESDVEKQLAEIKQDLSTIRESIEQIFKLMISQNK